MGEYTTEERLSGSHRLIQIEGEIFATIRWAWWKDGRQWVGSCGTTLADALHPLENEKRQIEERMKGGLDGSD